MRRWKNLGPLVLILILFLLPITASAQAGSAAKNKPVPSAKWTLMIYIAGDNNLDPYVISDIETELAPTGSNADVSVVALADREASADWSQALLFYIEPGMLATPETAVADWGEIDTGDPQVLIDFVLWTKAHYPTEHYALSFWNHGWSWRPGITMRDDTNGGSLNQDEIEAALAAVGPIDVIMYDACQMGTIENQATVQASSQAIVHSQEWVGWDGIEYELVIPTLQADPLMSPEALAVVINQSAAVNKELTGSAVALNDDWDHLIEAVDDWSLALLEGLPDHRHGIYSAFRSSQSFVQDTTAKDLWDLASQIQRRVNNAEIQRLSQTVMDAVDAVVLDEWHSQQYHGAHGISIYGPVVEKDLDYDGTPDVYDFEYYRQKLVFSRITHWDEFLDAFVNGG